MTFPALLLAIGNHQIEVAETLIQVGRFLVLFIAARIMAELMVRLSLPTIRHPFPAAARIRGPDQSSVA
jgi:hypothetical protein